MSLKALLKTKKEVASEVLLGLSKQPVATCPMIDKTIQDIHSFRGLISTAKYRLLEYEDLEPIDCHEEVQLVFVKKVIETKERLKEADRLYQAIEQELEKYRSHLEVLRKIGNDRKNLYWELLDSAFIVNQESKTYSHFQRETPPRSSLPEEAFNVDSFLFDLKNLEPLDFSSVGSSCDDCLLEGFCEDVEKVLAPVKELNFLKDTALDETVNGIYLLEWVDSMEKLSMDEAIENIKKLLEAQGFKQS